MNANSNLSNGSFRSNLSINSGIGNLMDDDFDQDSLSGRYGNTRDRHIPDKHSLSRTRQKKWKPTPVRQ